MNADVVLIGAGLVGGAMNAMAGGGSFVTLPALIASGLPPVMANASSSVALYPGGLASAWVYRKGIAAETGHVAGASLRQLAIVSLVGGMIGSVLLLATPTTLFDRVLPWLLLVATLALAFGRRIAAQLGGAAQCGPLGIVAGQFVLGIYGGYFGGAVGLMMMAFWSIVTTADIKSLQGPRVLLVNAANTTAIVIFAIMHAVAWRQVLFLAPAAMAGGYLGAHLATRMPAQQVRAATVALALIITIAFFVRAYA